jgi:arylsulfatase A-like enzyme
MKNTIPLVYGFLLSCTGLHGAGFIQGHTPGTGSELLAPHGGKGSVLIVDTVATGGNDISADNGTVARAFVIENGWVPGSSVVLSGIAFPFWASAPDTTLTSNSRNGLLSIEFYDLGSDGVFSGTGSELLIGSAPVSFSSAGSGVATFRTNFDTPVTFNAASSGVAIVLNHSSAIRLKEGPARTGVRQVRRTDGTDITNLFSMTLAGTVTAPVIRTAPTSGNWDQLAWSGSATNGDLGENDQAVIGQYRSVSYRGIPAGETISRLNLGQSATQLGQGVFRVASGNFTVNGDLEAGRFDSANDSFVEVNGGTLAVGGDAIFGRGVEGCDGSLTIGGGSVSIAGNLEMGAFEKGGSMLRFKNPGSSPHATVGGKLELGRCSLDLTFDSSYSHVPGTETTLVAFGTRVGQFLNFRQGQEFNSGPNRFRIDYLGNSIRLTALENWPVSPDRPNIIVLFADDQGYADLRLHGDARYPMPRLEALAQGGVRFTDCYASAGVCHPSRVGLITGIHQQRLGSDGNLSGPSYNGMPAAQHTVPRRLQGLGYRTYGIGKWHLGDTVEFHPNVRGFDDWYGMRGGSRSFWVNNTEGQVFHNQMTPDFQAEQSQTYLTDRIGNKAVDFIGSHTASSQDPFFMYVSFTAVHGPVDISSPPSPNPTDPRYARLSSEFGLTAADYLNSPRTFGATQAIADKNRYDLAAMTLALDENIGKIVDKLSQTPRLLEKTMIVYLNDNGGAEWAQGFSGNFSYNTPLKGKKGARMDEGAMRIPGVANWPGKIPAGTVFSQPVSTLDFAATFVNAASDAPAGARNGLDGLDLLPAIKGEAPFPAERGIAWRGIGTTGGGIAMRMGKWKLWMLNGDTTPSLFNLETDIRETTNLANAEPEITAALFKRFLAWEARTLPPAYGTTDTQLDPGLERYPFAGGLRLKTNSTSPLWQSASLRFPQAMAENFFLGFLMKPSEAGPYSAGAGLWHGLGDSVNRAAFIRFGIDFENGSIEIHEGQTGATASAPVVTSPGDFSSMTVSYQASDKTLTLTLGATSVSLPLTGAYTALTTSAMGASAMEGEITTLRPVSPDSSPETSSLDVRPALGSLVLTSRFDADPPFNPVLQRSTDLLGFTTDPAAITDSLGGGVYRLSTWINSENKSEFFRINTENQ